MPELRRTFGSALTRTQVKSGHIMVTGKGTLGTEFLGGNPPPESVLPTTVTVTISPAKDEVRCHLMGRPLPRQEARHEVYELADPLEREICSARCLEGCAS